MKAIYALGLTALLFSGCVKGLEKTASLPYAARAEYQNQPKAGESLFGTDEAVLRGANIEQILTSKFVIPPKARLAIMRFGERRPFYWWSEEFARLDQEIENGMLAGLRAAKRLADVSLLPSMMVPERQSIPYLREAAARCQADLLMVYRSETRTFDRSRFLRPDEVKARCRVEARSGSPARRRSATPASSTPGRSTSARSATVQASRCTRVTPRRVSFPFQSWSSTSRVASSVSGHDATRAGPGA